MFDIPKPQVEIPPGTYKATLLGVQVKSGGQFKDPEKNPDGSYRMWDWLVDVNGEGVEFSDTTSLNNGPKTVSYQRLTALLGEAPQAGKSYDPPTGKTCLLQIVKKDNGYPKVEFVLPYVEPQTEAGLPR